MYRDSVVESEDSFSSRVQYNFKTQLLLCLKGKNWTREDILSTIYELPGYKCHKVARYGYKWSHIHIKFEEESQAEAAIIALGTVNPDLSAILVDNMLREWYNFEMKFDYGPTWTMTVVDTVGPTPRCLNFLTENILTYLFQDFGRPYLLPYTAALNEAHVQMAFYSMTEALAACMAFGQWFRMNQKLDQFCYRVRINPAQRETFLIRNCGGNAEEAFMLDYFVNLRNEVIQSQEVSGLNNNENELRDSTQLIALNRQEVIESPSIKEMQDSRWYRKPKINQNESRNELVSQKTRRPKQQRRSIEYRSNATLQQNKCTPLVYLPIITPINSSYAHALVASAGFTNTPRNCQKSYAEVLESDSNSITGKKLPLLASNLGKENAEMECGNEANKSVIPSEKDESDSLNCTLGFDRSETNPKYHYNGEKLKRHIKRNTRVFERRDISQTKSKV